MAHFGRFRLPLAVVVGRRLATVGDSHREFVRDFNADFPCWRRRGIKPWQPPGLGMVNRMAPWRGMVNSYGVNSPLTTIPASGCVVACGVLIPRQAEKRFH